MLTSVMLLVSDIW